MAKFGTLVNEASGRLTLESGVPISTADQSAKTTLYWTPYQGNNIEIYNSQNGQFYEFSQLSLSLAGYTASRNYDVWVYDNAGTLTLESLIWTNATTRATALTTQDGYYVKTGATTRRYLGTIAINSTGGQCEDTNAFRGVWNNHNRVLRPLEVAGSNSHAYAVAAWRSWDNDATIRVEYVCGVIEEDMRVSLFGHMDPDADVQEAWVGSGYDVTNASANPQISTQVAQAFRLGVAANRTPGLGYHYIQTVQYVAAGSTTFAEINLHVMLLM